MSFRPPRRRNTGKVSFPNTALYAEAMIRNSSTADINTAGWTAIPFTSPHVVTVDDGFAATGGGIRCDFDGRVEVTASIHCTSTGQRAAVAIRICRNGTDQGPRGASGYIRASTGHDRASMHLRPMVVFVEDGDIITVEGQRDTDITDAVNLIEHTSFLRVKRLPSP